MPKKRFYYFDLSQEQSTQIERMEVFACEGYSSYSLNVYFRLNSIKDVTAVFKSIQDLNSITNICKDMSNKPSPRTPEHDEQDHVPHEKTYLSHVHIYFNSPITLSDLREYFDKLSDECKKIDDSFRGVSTSMLIELIRYMNPISACRVMHFINHGELKEGEFFLKKSAMQEFIASYENHLQKELFRACALGDIDETKYLLNTLGVSVNCQDEAGRTPLHYAVMRSHLVSKYDQYLDVAACMANHPAIVRMLMCDYDADPQIQNCSGNTVRMLIDRDKASENPLDRETAQAIEESLETALFQACALGNLKQIKALLDSGVSVNCQDELGRTPLHYAVMRSDLVEKIYASDMTEASMDIESVMSKHPEVVRMLLVDYHADGRIENKNKNTPFDLILRDKNLNDGSLTQKTAQAVFDALPIAAEITPRQIFVSSPVTAAASIETAPTQSQAEWQERRGEHSRARYLAALSRATFFLLGSTRADMARNHTV